MIKILGIILLAGSVLAISWFLLYNTYNNDRNAETGPVNMETIKESEITLPSPQETSQVSIEEALLKRRSVRQYKDEPLNLEEISQLLWAAQGINDSKVAGRTSPSAGATYPLEVYLTVRKADKIKPGVYRYLPENHKLIKVSEGDVSGQLAETALNQMFIGQAPVSLVFSAVFERTTGRYGQRGVRYVYMEAGHASQNVYLQAQSLRLVTVVVGAFDEEEVKEILNLPQEEIPLYIMPVGKPL